MAYCNKVDILCKLFVFPFLLHQFFNNHFSKAGSKWEGGIENVYHDPCQDWMDLINMRLSSPNYPKPYSPLEHCIWAIIAPEGHFVSLDFKEISVSKLEND